MLLRPPRLTLTDTLFPYTPLFRAATTTCGMIAREQTGRRKVLVANGAYHGAVPWCNPYPQGSLPEDRAHVLRYDYNDPASLDAAAAEAGTDLAGILVSEIGRAHV